MNETDICTICGKPRKGKGLSLSQWVLDQEVCACDLMNLEQETTHVLTCERCKKPLPHFVGGTLTQWIVHPEKCSCEAGPLLDQSNIEQPSLTELKNPDKTFNLLNGESLNEEFTREIGLDVDRYVVLSVIGSRLSGIFKCLDKNLNRRVAIKMLLQDIWDDKKIVQFQQEARVTARLNHENVIDIFNFGITEDQKPYMVIEYLDGISLREHLSDKDSLPWENAIIIFEQICHGLEHAHKLKLIHGDIKPDNVILINSEIEDVRVKIIDFGISKFLETDQSLTSSGIGTGTPPYMSPEQIRSEVLDTRTDIYSLGCLMYEVLTGQVPFLGETALDTVQMHLEETAPDFPDSLSLPAGLKILVKRCLNKDRNLRPSSAQKIIEILLQIKEESSISLIDLQDQEARPARHRIGLVLLSLMAGLIGAGLLVNNIVNEAPVSKRKPISTKPLKNLWSDFKVKLSEDYQLPHTYHCIGKVEESDLIEFKKKHPHAQGFGLGTADIKGDVLRHLEGMKLRYLKLDNTPIKDSQLNFLNTLEDLEVLTLNDCKYINGDGFKFLTKLNKLRTLNLSRCKLNDRAFKYIGKLKSLRILNLRGTDCSIASLAHNLQNTDLDFLGLSKLTLTASDLKILAENVSTRELDLRYCKGFPPASLSELAKMKNLNILAVTEMKTGSSFYEGLSKLSNLRTIKFSETSLKNAKPIERMRDLEKLFFIKCKNLDPEGLEHFSKLDKINSIAFIKSPQKTESLANINKLKNLKSLTMQASSISPRGLKELGNLRLHYLDLSYSVLNPLSMKNLATTLETKTLNLTKCVIDSPEDIESLSKIRSLEELLIDQIGSPKDFYHAISHIKNLQRLTLDHTNFSRTSSLSKLKNLTAISFRYSRAPSQDMVSLKSLPNLKKLSIENCRFDSSLVPPLSKLKINSLILKSVAPLSNEDISKLTKISSINRLELFGFYLKPNEMIELHKNAKCGELLLDNIIRYDQYIIHNIYKDQFYFDPNDNTSSFKNSFQF